MDKSHSNPSLETISASPSSTPPNGNMSSPVVFKTESGNSSSNSSKNNDKVNNGLNGSDDSKKKSSPVNNGLGYISLTSQDSYRPVSWTYFGLMITALCITRSWDKLIAGSVKQFSFSSMILLGFIAIYIVIRIGWLVYILRKRREPIILPIDEYDLYQKNGCSGTTDTGNKDDSDWFLPAWNAAWFAVFFEVLAVGTLFWLLFHARISKRDPSVEFPSLLICIIFSSFVFLSCTTRFVLSIHRYRLSNNYQASENGCDIDGSPIMALHIMWRWLKRAAFAEVFIFCFLPMVMAAYFVLTLLGVMKDLNEMWQHYVKIPLYACLLISILLSYFWYSPIYPSLALLNLLFLLGLSVEVGVFYGCYDLRDGSIFYPFTWKEQIYVAAPMIVAQIIIFCLSCSFNCCREFRDKCRLKFEGLLMSPAQIRFVRNARESNVPVEQYHS